MLYQEKLVTGRHFLLEQTSKSGGQDFLSLAKIETPRRLREKIETARHITAKKIDTARLMKFGQNFARPIVFEALHCIRQPFYTPFYNNQYIIVFLN